MAPSLPRCESSAVAVGHAVSVPRDDEDPLALMRASHVVDADSEPDRIIPQAGKVSEYGGEGGLLEDAPGPPLPNRAPCAGNVLPHDDRWAKFGDEARLLSPET